jgi:dinuclear metal center YbgI/SA1388 family protein
MIELTQLLNHLNILLEPEKFIDYCPNGLQIFGRENISKIVTGITASQELINKAIDLQADTLIVHHGYFWKNEDPVIKGMKRQRIKSLLENNINLIAYHLPLDAHLVYGNNVKLAEILDFKIEGPVAKDSLVFMGELPSPMKGEDLAKHISKSLDREPQYIPAKQKKITTIAWCTGAAQNYIQSAIDAGVDAYLTGEISEQTVHIARENNLHFYAAGHHATERYGVKALGEHLAEQFNLKHHFIDIDNPV